MSQRGLVAKPARGMASAWLACGLLLAACGGSAAPATAPGASPAAPSQPARTQSPAASAPPPSAASASPEAGASSTLHVSYSQVSMSYVPTWVGEDGGIFAKKGLNVDLQLVESAPGMAALLSGQTDLAEIGGTEAVDAVAGGADLEVVATAIPVYPYVLEVQPSIKQAADLKGGKIGITRFGSTIDTATRLALGKLGLTANDVTLVQLSSVSARTAALLNGAIQGGLSQPPDSLKLEASGMHTLVDMAALHLPAAITVVVGKRAWIQAHRDAAQRFIDAYVEATAREKAAKTFTIGVMKQHLKFDDEKALEATYDFYSTRVVPSLPFPRADQFSDIVGPNAQNPKVRGLDVNKLLDASLVQNAADRKLDSRAG